MHKFRFNHRSAHCMWLKLVVTFFIFCSIAPSNVFAQTPVSVLIGPTAGTGNWFFGPLYRNTTNAGTLNYSRYAYIYTAAELGIPSGAKIVKLEWLKKDGGTIVAPNTFNIWMTNTTATSLPTTAAWSSVISGATQTYANSSMPLTIGNNTYLECPFNVPGSDSFTYTGGSLQIMTDWAKQGIQTGSGINFYVLAASGKAIGISSQTTPTNSIVLQAATYGNARPTIRITYVPVPACSGVPSPGAAISNSSTVCAGVPFTLTIQNTIPGTGVSYLWQRAEDINFTTNLTNLGTGATLTTSENASFYYRCTATCSGSGLSDNSTPIYVPMSPHYGCYCPSSPLSAADEEILNFTFGSLNNSSDCNSTAPGIGSAPQLYSNYQGIPAPNVEKESVVPFSIQVGTCSSVYPNRTVIFIDYNHNSVFEASEAVYTTPSAISGPHTEAGNITIPSTALTGLTGLRVITEERSNPFNLSTIACATYSWGETEDYLINITPTTICAGAPTPGNTISSASSVCAGGNVSLSLQNLTTGLGVTYQWYNSAGAIAGATSFNLVSAPIPSAETFYCAVTCTNSGLTTNSNPISISMKNFIDCYCQSGASNEVDEDIFHFTFNGVDHSTDCNTTAPGPGSILGRYSNFKTLGSIALLNLGQSVPYDIETDDCDQSPYYSFGTSIWIDFNQNGSFSDPGEQVFVENAPIEGPRHIIGNITIPCTAKVGQTGMRVSIVDGLAAPYITPCLSYQIGETEDYIITLKYPDTCNVASNPPGNTIGSVTSFCSSASSVLTLQNKCLFDNYTYQWYQGNYPGTIIPGATTKTYTTPTLYNTTTYYCQVSCGANNVISTPLTIHKVVLTSNTTVSAPSYCLGSAPILVNSTATATGVPTNIIYSYSPATGLSSPTGASITANPSATTTYTVTATNPIGCFSTNTFTIASTRLNVDLVASSTSYCTPSGTPVILTASGGTQYSYTPAAGLSAVAGSPVTATPTTTTTYIVTGSDSTGCSGVDSVMINVTPCYITLNVKFFIEGYYDAGNMKPVLSNQGEGNNVLVTDSVDLELHNSVSPFETLATQRVVVSTNGMASANFLGVNAGAYYVAVKHRNGLETWSANPVAIDGTLYDFTSSSSKAYGDNMKEVETGIWAFYSGEINSDGNIDLVDLSILEADINNFAFGYLFTDLNGDGNVDLVDLPFMENNLNAFIYSNHP